MPTYYACHLLIWEQSGLSSQPHVLPFYHPWQATFQQQVLAQLLQMTEQNRLLLAGRSDGR